jgi:hypothetical protein
MISPFAMVRITLSDHRALGVQIILHQPCGGCVDIPSTPTHIRSERLRFWIAACRSALIPQSLMLMTSSHHSLDHLLPASLPRLHQRERINTHLNLPELIFHRVAISTNVSSLGPRTFGQPPVARRLLAVMCPAQGRVPTFECRLSRLCPGGKRRKRRGCRAQCNRKHKDTAR